MTLDKATCESLLTQNSPKIENPVSFTKKDTEDVLNLTNNLINKHGPRLAGGKSANATANDLKKIWEQYVDHSQLEKFPVYRDAFLSFMRVFVLCFALGSVSIFLGGYWLIMGIITFAFGSIFAIEQFVTYHHTFDKLFPSFPGHNVVGTLEPEHETTHTIIISGHHDSAYEFNFFKKFQKWYSPRIYIGLIVYHVLEILLWIPLFFGLISYNGSIYQKVVFGVFLVGIPTIGQFFFFKGKRGTPGAGDNLVSSAIVTKLSEKYGKLKQQGKGFSHTRLIFLSTDGEESALSGAFAFVKSHLEELKTKPTYVLNMDSLYHVNELSLLSTDLNQFVELSSDLNSLCQQAGYDLGYTLQANQITWGGGGTDAAAFAKNGIKAITLIGMENQNIRDGLVYHTMNDTVDKIESEVVEATMKIITRTICYIQTKMI